LTRIEKLENPTMMIEEEEEDGIAQLYYENDQEIN